MSKLLRYFAPDQCVFVTSVTAGRQRFLDHQADLLKRAVRNARTKSRFELVAWVILPDHFHLLISSPNGDTARIVQRVKLSFSVQWRNQSGYRGPVWQHRYWDHILRDQEDLNRHIDYIHYNPVKHGLVQSPDLWAHSSFHKYRQAGCYDTDWGEKQLTWAEDEFGE